MVSRCLLRAATRNTKESPQRKFPRASAKVPAAETHGGDSRDSSATMLGLLLLSVGQTARLLVQSAAPSPSPARPQDQDRPCGRPVARRVPKPLLRKPGMPSRLLAATFPSSASRVPKLRVLPFSPIRSSPGWTRAVVQRPRFSTRRAARVSQRRRARASAHQARVPLSWIASPMRRWSRWPQASRRARGRTPPRGRQRTQKSTI